MDPIREVQATRAAEILAGAAKGANRLLGSGHLDAAEQTLWRGIKAAENELRGEGVEGPAPGAAPGEVSEPPSDLDDRHRDVAGEDVVGEDDTQEPPT